MGLRGGHLTPAQKGWHVLPAVIALGLKRGTKVRRPQSVTFQEDSDPVACVLVAAFAATTAAEQPLSSINSIKKMGDLINWGSRYLGYTVHFTPHSCRAGWASEMKIKGHSFSEIKDRGRWATDESTKIYLDVVSSMYHLPSVASAEPYAQWLLEDFATRFPWWG